MGVCVAGVMSVMPVNMTVREFPSKRIEPTVAPVDVTRPERIALSESLDEAYALQKKR